MGIAQSGHVVNAKFIIDKSCLLILNADLPSAPVFTNSLLEQTFKPPKIIPIQALLTMSCLAYCDQTTLAGQFLKTLTRVDFWNELNA